MIPTNPLTKPHVDRFAGFPEPVNSPGEEEIERRVQELLNEWFEFYFSGQGFQTPAQGEGTVVKSLYPAKVLWDMATLPNPLTNPVLHVVLADRRDANRTEVDKNFWRVQGKWTWNLIVRVPPQMPVTTEVDRTSPESASVDAGRVCRKLGDQCRWLMNSAHLQELAVKGIQRMKVENGPRIMQGGAWHLRQIVFSAVIVHHELSNHP